MILVESQGQEGTVGTAQVEFQSMRVFRVSWFANEGGTLFAANTVSEAMELALAWANTMLDEGEEPIVKLQPYAITSIVQESSIVVSMRWDVP